MAPALRLEPQTNNMSVLSSLQAKIASVTSFTQLNSIITSDERALLSTGLNLLQPCPWLKRATGESRFWGIDHLGSGSFVATNCPISAFPESYGNLRAASDAELLAGMVAIEAVMNV